MKFFTRRQWLEHVAEQRANLAAARNSKPRDHEREELARLRKVINELWAKHSKPYPDGDPGDSRFGQVWWCSECRTQWPCRIARAVFKAKGMGHDYLPLRLPIRGEKRLSGAIQLGGGHWIAVPGVVPDEAPKPTAEESA